MKTLILAAAFVVAAATAAFAATAPTGSYQKTCTGIAYDGTTLTAQCKTMQGASVSASLAYPASCVGDVGNINGILACTGPSGSYALTCRNTVVQGNTLSGECQTKSGSWVPASLPNFQGFQGDVTNCNGVLQNGGTCK